MRLPGFIGGSNYSQSLIAEVERTVNWYVEPLTSVAKNQAALYPTPGQSPLITVSDVGTRGLLSVNGRTHGVIGPSVYELLPSTQAATSRGSVTQDNNPAQLAYNGAAGGQIAIASGGNLY